MGCAVFLAMQFTIVNKIRGFTRNSYGMTVIHVGNQGTSGQKNGLFSSIIVRIGDLRLCLILVLLRVLRRAW
jgi:hypothetical protein